MARQEGKSLLWLSKLIVTSEGVGGEGALEEGEGPEDQAGHAHWEGYQVLRGQHWDEEQDEDN